VENLSQPVEQVTDALDDTNPQPHIEAEEFKRERLKKASTKLAKAIGTIAGVLVVAIAFAALFGSRRTT
jgi:uncharacterized membrane protein YraQ (UPF0718 family)